MVTWQHVATHGAQGSSPDPQDVALVDVSKEDARTALTFTWTCELAPSRKQQRACLWLDFYVEVGKGVAGGEGGG